MAADNTTAPEALKRALALLAKPPRKPVLDQGYLDLLGPATPTPPGPIQRAWESGLGSNLYDHAQAAARRLLMPAEITSWVRVPPGGRALDVGSGPGNITGALGRAAGPEGLALGIDVSEPMLERAVAAEANRTVGFLRASASSLPFRDEIFDAVTCLAVLQLIPDPVRVLAEIARVTAPGGQLAILVPSERGGVLDVGTRVFSVSGVREGLSFFAGEEIGARLLEYGFTTAHTHHSPILMRVTATKAD